MDNDMKLYYDYAKSPLGTLFYKTVFSQLNDIQNKKVLDFGSGFAFTSDFLAQNNDVWALERSEVMIENTSRQNNYNQITGDLSALKNMNDESFDVVICHLVLEFVNEPISVFINELARVLKKGGLMSIIRHNKNGRIVQAVVVDYDLDDAHHLMSGGNSYSSAFGNIKYYTNEELFAVTSPVFKAEKIYGVRTLASLHSANIMQTTNWTDKMFKIESELCKNTDFINIAYFNHILLRKMQ